MKIKRIAVGLTSLAAGLGLLAGAFAADLTGGLGQLVEFDQAAKTLKSPAFVVGDNVPGSDVIGAVDIAAAVVSHYATVEKTVPAGGAVTTVTGGVDLATATKKLYIGSQIASGKEVLTKDDLPTILPDGVFKDSDGNEYTYTQYIYIGKNSNRKISFGQYNADIDPDMYVDVGTDVSAPLYSIKIVFDKAIDFSKPEVRSEDIELLGTKYTIANDATNKTIILYGSALKETLDVGVEKTITFDGTEYTLKLVGIASDQSTATIQVNGEYKSVEKNKEYTVSGLTFYVDEIVRWDVIEGQGYGGFIKISIGSNKVIFENGQPVKVGDDETSIDGTNVTIKTGTDGVSVIQIDVAAEDTDVDYIASGESFADPVFQVFKVAFGGLTPTIDSDARETISVTSSGDYAYIEFTDHKGNSKKIDFAYYDGSSLGLKSDKESIVVVEGNKVEKNDYVVINAGDFPHILKVIDIDPATSTDPGSVKLKDVFSDVTYDITLPKGPDNDVEKVIDGQTYYIKVTDAATDYIQITWKSTDDDNPSFGEPGKNITVFPALKTAKGAYIAFIANVTIEDFDSGDSVVLPDGNSYLNGTDTAILGNIGVKVYDKSGDMVVEFKGKEARAGILLVEEETDDKSPGAGKKYGSFIEVKYDSTDDEVEIQEPIIGDGTSFLTLETNDNYKIAIDGYGTYFKYNTKDKTELEIKYPDEQAIANLAIGSNPQFTTTISEAGMYKEAVEIESPIAKFASEIPTDSTLNQHLLLVGGPCANSVVEKLLEEAWNVTDACASWNEKLGNNNALLKLVEDVFGSGKSALIVAGTTADDTRELSKKVMDPEFFSDKSGTEWMGSV